MVPIMMFYMGLSNFTGQNMGAGKLDRIRRGYRQTMVMAMITCAAIILLLIFAGPYAIRLYHMNEAATAIGVEYLRTLAGFFLIFCVMYVTNGVLQGSGDVLYPTAGSMTSLAVRVIIANVMATIPAIGYRSIFYSIPRGLAVRYGHRVYSVFDGKMEGEKRGEAVMTLRPPLKT